MPRVDISDRDLLECATAKAAQSMLRKRSGRRMYAIATECGMSESHLSRCLNINDDLNLPHDKVIQFMVSCGNAGYLRWQYLKLKELLPEMENDDAGCITDSIETLRLLLSETIGAIKAAQPPQRCGECGAQFALSEGMPFVPGWLANQAWIIEEEFGRVS